MIKGLKKPKIKARKRWLINPKTRVRKSALVYDRRRKKKEIEELYGTAEDET